MSGNGLRKGGVALTVLGLVRWPRTPNGAGGAHEPWD